MERSSPGRSRPSGSRFPRTRRYSSSAGAMRSCSSWTAERRGTSRAFGRAILGLPPQRQRGGARAPGRVAHRAARSTSCCRRRASGGSTSTMTSRQTLRGGHGAVFEDDSCIIFRLGGEGQSAAAFETAERVTPHVTELVDRLLPADASVAVVSSGRRAPRAARRPSGVDFPPMFRRRHRRFTRERRGDSRHSSSMRGDGVEYLVVPHISPSWLDLHPDFVGEVERRFPCVARRKDVGSVFALADAGSPTDETDRGQRPRTGWCQQAGAMVPAVLINTTRQPISN